MTWIILALVVAVAGYAVVTYNRLVKSGQLTDEAWSGIDVQLKRRSDLIPNLVDSVKGYATHERDVLQTVAALRGAAASVPADDVTGRARAEGALSLALGRLVALAEAYPDLKASGNFIALQKELSAVENDLQMARRYYNGATRNLNVLIQSVPSNLVAGVTGFRERPFFELSDTADRAVPQIKL